MRKVTRRVGAIGAMSTDDFIDIAVEPSTRNRQTERDPEMHQTKKDNQYHFRTKAHIVSEVRHSMVATAANEASITQDHHFCSRKTA